MDVIRTRLLPCTALLLLGDAVVCCKCTSMIDQMSFCMARWRTAAGNLNLKSKMIFLLGR